MSRILLQFLILAGGICIAPLLGGLVAGVDRVLTARLQGRVGPPFLQPFYDVGKLFGKTQMATNIWQALCPVVGLVAAMIAVGLFVLQGDLLVIFFAQAVTAACIVVGALSVSSPYGQIGAQRELLQMLAYEPLYLLVVVGVFLKTGSFNIESVYAFPRPLLLDMPLLFVAFGFVLTIKFRKSPFDIASSHHAHQEIVRGVYTDYSGPHLAILEIAHWYENALLLGLCGLFWATSFWGACLLAIGVYVLEIWVDNVSARLTWRWMLGSAWGVGLTLAVLNLIWLQAR